MLLLAVVAGMALSVQAAVNASLSSSLGVLKTAFLTFALGSLCTGLLIVFFQAPHAQTLLDVPKWQLMGAFLGVPYILIMAYSVKKIGAAVATVAVIFGQLSMSLLIDHFAWLGNAGVAFSSTRFLAMLCLLIALYCIYQSQRHSDQHN